jgi:hypothetical protein
MAQKTRSQLNTEANVIKNETATAANTAVRVGTMYLDDIESEVNWQDDVVTDLSTNDDNHVPTVKAVVDGIAAAPTPTLQAVTDIGAETDNPLLVRQAGDTQNLLRKNGILHTSEATGSTSTWLSFNTPTGTGSIAIQDAGNSSETLAFLSDITSGVQSVTGTTVDNTDPLNPIVNVPTLQQVTDAGNSTNLIKVIDYANKQTWLTPTGLNHLENTEDVSVEFQTPTRNFGVIQFQDVAGGTEVVAFLSDIPPAGSTAWGAITGTLSAQTDLQTALNAKQDTLTASNFHTFSDSLTAMTTPVDADKLNITDNSASLQKKITWANVKAALQTFFDGIYTAKNPAITGATKTKVTYDSKGLVTSATDATTADIADTTNKRYVTDANNTKLGFISITQAVDLDVLESDTVTNNAKVTNATHTGEVTGSGALTVDKTAITNKTLVSVATNDKILISDTSDSGNLKYVTASDIASLAGGTVISGTSVVDFGNENDWATLTVANGSITTAGIKNVSIIPQETTETSLDDFGLNNVSFAIENIIDNVSFAIRGIAGNNASGNYTVKYLITI